ncbi:MAG TPA: cysteine--tRNA ligase [Candidatus Acidoferrales bacterium]|nr:cysteine--tRNA ligase [Candidatus Acidoferrales bacterium]
MSVQPALSSGDRTTKAEIRFHNTLTDRTEPFVPLVPSAVRAYTCGPTVYDFAHIGNFRTFVFQDVLRRYLKSRGFRVIQVMNLTDVDDRIIQKAAAAGVSIRDYTDKYIQAYLDDRRALNLEPPEYIARATEHIDDMVELIQRLTEKGFTYTSEGSTYYRISKFPSYGKLSKIDVAGMQTGARVDLDRYDKDNARDFALWKAPKPGEHFWETAIGPGRPGWHIECAAMALKYLGDTLDIHSGGVDLTFPHHENEIAEAEAATGKPFVRYWLHAEHLLVDHEKMSKSLGNFATLRELFSHGHKPSSVRFLLASVPYRRQLNFTPESLQGAASSVERLKTFVLRMRTGKFPDGSSPAMAARTAKAKEDFDSGLADDLNTAVALAAIFDLVRDVNTAMDHGEFRQGDAALVLDVMDNFDAIFAVLRDDDAQKLNALGITTSGPSLSDAEIEALIAERQAARKRRDFAASDRIREQLAESGIILEDSRDGGVRWKRK